MFCQWYIIINYWQFYIYFFTHHRQLYFKGYDIVHILIRLSSVRAQKCCDVG